jgi:hypothetical protein
MSIRIRRLSTWILHLAKVHGLPANSRLVTVAGLKGQEHYCGFLKPSWDSVPNFIRKKSDNGPSGTDSADTGLQDNDSDSLAQQRVDFHQRKSIILVRYSFHVHTRQCELVSSTSNPLLPSIASHSYLAEQRDRRKRQEPFGGDIEKSQNRPKCPSYTSTRIWTTLTRINAGRYV